MAQLMRNHIRITSDVFFDIFPYVIMNDNIYQMHRRISFRFIIVFNRGMRVRNIGMCMFGIDSPINVHFVGMALLRVMPRLVGKKINMQFVLLRPFIRFRWEEVRSMMSFIFFDL